MPQKYWPLEQGFTITSPYGPRDGGFHAGVDFGWEGGSGGKAVYAVQSGTVIYAGAASGFGGPDPAGWVVVDSSDSQGSGVYIYGHVIREVGVGDQVVAGQRIAHINPDQGTNGGVAPHCHLAHCAYAYSDTQRDDPAPYLQGASYPGVSLTNPPTPSTTPNYWADVSEFQAAVDDRYPYRILCIRSNDGDYRDNKFARNYEWARGALDAGQLDVLIVYFYWRPNWQTCVDVHKDMVGNPHPRMITMIDVERGGNPSGDQSAALNATYQALTSWLGNGRRVIAYANSSDEGSMWPNRPAGLQTIGAGYPDDPDLDNEIGHQYTDGSGYGTGPQGCQPFGNCDMNESHLSVPDFAAAVGIALPGGSTSQGGDVDQATADNILKLLIVLVDQACGPGTAQAILSGKGTAFAGWPQGGGRTMYDLIAAAAMHLGATNASDTKAAK